VRLRTWAVISLVPVMSVGEIALLERKYNYFSGGFLTKYRLTEPLDIAVFLTSYIWFTSLLLLVAAVPWFALYRRLRLPSGIAIYHYVIVVGGTLVGALCIKYEVLRYFSDTVDFNLIKSLGGGSLVDALRYATNEMSTAGIAIATAIAVLIAGHLALRRWRILAAPIDPLPVRPWAVAALAAVMVTGSVGMIIAVESNPTVRYGLGRTIAYRLAVNGFSSVYDLRKPTIDLGPFRQYATLLPLPQPLDWSNFPLRQNPPNIAIFVLESTRGDVVHKTIGDKLVAPNLSKLADEGSYFKYAYSHAGFTNPSLKAVFGARYTNRPANGNSLFEILKRERYRISVISGQSEGFGDIDQVTGMAKSADLFFDARSAAEDRLHPFAVPASLLISARRLLVELRRQLDLPTSRPQFFYFNVQEPHFPYWHRDMESLITAQHIERSEISESRKDVVALTYWNAVANADKFIGDATELFKEHGLYNNMLVLVIGDHGESLFDDHFLGHGHAVSEIQTRIPFVLNRPGIRIREPIGEVEIRDILLRQIVDCQDAAGKPGAHEGQSPCGESSPVPQGGDKLVFQYIGDVEHPPEIGTVGYGEERTILDFESGKIFFSDRGRWFAASEVLADPVLCSRVGRVLAEWDKAKQQ
jgi:glucan phosphoethanolaminetransferase (alkaline phosphatase superfamily)